VKALSPITSRKGSLEQQGAHDIVGDTNHALDLAVLWGRVGTRHPKLDTVRERCEWRSCQIHVHCRTGQDTPDDTTKLREHISEKVRERGGRVRVMAQRKGPRVMSTIIQNNQIVLISRNTGYKRSPKITMDQINSTYNPRRSRKR
jgi:hypothetical protein